MKTKKIIRQFICTTKINDIETTTKVSAIVSASYGKRFVLRVECIKIRGGKIIMDNKANEYYDTGIELKTEFECNFYLCKNNILTTSIHITK